MEWLETIYYMTFGLVLRFALPVLFTVLVIIWLRWLDDRWQKEADDYLHVSGAPSFWDGRVPCWDIKGCSEERRASCPAYQNNRVACWQAFRRSDGQLKEECIGCNVFLNTAPPIPA